MSEYISQSDPKANYLAHKEEIDSAIHRVLDSGWYILGGEVSALEKEFAAYLGVGQAVGVGSGTDALHLALRASGTGSGDFVITTSNTAVATAAAIRMCGATPFFVDIDPASFAMDPNSLEDTIKRFPSHRFKAVVPVHLYGHPADMKAIMDIATRYSLYVIEDCAQSHGATFFEKKTGTLGHLGAFSFYPTKNLGGLGDGGMVVTSDPKLGETVRLLREYGWKTRYVSQIPGFNSRLDEIQAAVLRVKLHHLDTENDRRRRLADLYHSLLDQSGVVTPRSKSGSTHVFHQYVVRTDRRDELMKYLLDKKIKTLIHYPVPIHLQPAYTNLSESCDLRRTETVAAQIVSLPMFPELGEHRVKTVANHILNWCDKTRY